MAANIPLSFWSATNPTNPHSQIAIGKTALSKDGRGFWIVVLDRTNPTAPVLNTVVTDYTKTPNLGNYNTADYILIAISMGIGLNQAPQGDFFKFLDVNGGGRELRRVEQVGQAFNCGYWGTFGYCLCGVLGNQNKPGFEASQIGSTAGNGPMMTLTLVPTTIGSKTIYTPGSLSNA